MEDCLEKVLDKGGMTYWEQMVKLWSQVEENAEKRRVEKDAKLVVNLREERRKRERLREKEERDVNQ
mgnify:CR=1 FL=1